MASSIPKEAKKEIADAYVAETWKVALYTTLNTSATYSTTNEVSSTGYDAGGALVASKTSGYVDTVNAYVDANDVTWTGVTFTARSGIVYNTVTGVVRRNIDFGENKPVSGGTFKVQWNAGGLVKVSS